MNTKYFTAKYLFPLSEKTKSRYENGMRGAT